MWVGPNGEDAVAGLGLNGKQHIFISYRHSDCQAQANGLHDGLVHRLRNASLFMDLDSIPPGVDFEQHIRDEIRRSDVILVMIGDNWLDDRPGTNRRRIDEPNDFVRLEIENALAMPGVRIIPVLVEGAQMPAAEELPSVDSPTRTTACVRVERPAVEFGRRALGQDDRTPRKRAPAGTSG